MKRLTMQQQKELFDLFNEVYDEGNKRYRLGWSDEKVAEHFNITKKHVSYRRIQLYGPMYELQAPAPAQDQCNNALELRLTKLELEVQAIKKLWE